jgi:hypothetical protein
MSRKAQPLLGWHDEGMLGLLALLLIIWLFFIILGIVIKGLLWLALIGIVLFLATGACGWLKRRTSA